MKALVSVIFLCISLSGMAQERCGAFPYQQSAATDATVNAVEAFISGSELQHRTTGGVLRIPVVFHNLYHYPDEKITEQQVAGQLALLNACFRRTNADTVNTPEVFRPFAADVEIEFVLAISDPRRAATTGIIRKYTPVTAWTMDDKMKFSTEMGADAWDSRYFLNIWVVNLDRFAGYSSFPGGETALDGIVIDLDALGGKTLVHETGHWLGLRHLWGDALCGDDYVDDTPKQASYTPGCPKTTRITCGNGPHGDMYMNYMDFTSDACMNLFTTGQKNRMRSLFNAGGPRADLPNSIGLLPPLMMGAPVEEYDPKWLHPQLYPNPAQSVITLDLSYDPRWIGQQLRIVNMTGQPVMHHRIPSTNCQLNISSLKPGVYFLLGSKPGEEIRFKFVKQ